MKRNGILNSDISRVLSYMGHTDTLAVGDCGLRNRVLSHHFLISNKDNWQVVKALFHLSGIKWPGTQTCVAFDLLSREFYGSLYLKSLCQFRLKTKQDAYDQSNFDCLREHRYKLFLMNRF